MAVAPSFQDLLTVGEAELKSRRPDLVVADGDVTQAMLHASAAMADAVIRFGAQAFKDTFIDGASGDALTALVDDHLNIQREASSSAEVDVDFTRTSGGTAGTIPGGTIVATGFDADGEQVQFALDSPISVGAGLNGPFTGTCTATVAGRDGNVAATTISQLLNVPSFDDTFSVSNPAAAGGGNDEETDVDLRERARNYFVTLRRGTLAALEYGALLVSTVRFAKAVEDATTAAVTVRVSDSDGNSTAQMITDVEAELENWRCAGVALSVVGGNKITVEFEINIAAKRDGFDVAAQESVLIDAVVGRVNKLKAGETLYLDSVIASIIAVYPDDIYDVEFTSIVKDGVAATVGDITATSTEVIRTETGVISFTG